MAMDVNDGKNTITILDIFDYIRFPLILGIVFLHNIGYDNDMPDLSLCNLTCEPLLGIYDIIRILLSGVLPLVAVPAFFFMSGFLFFYGKEWSINIYKYKIKRRINSLVIPYIFWNFITIFLIVLACNLKPLIMGILNNERVCFQFNGPIWFVSCFFNVGGGISETMNWLRWPYYHSYPIDDPLWFLRDLILLSLATPILYRLLNKLGGYF